MNRNKEYEQFKNEVLGAWPADQMDEVVNDWERQVLNLLIDRLNIPNGDAQGIYEVKEQQMRELYSQGKSPEDAVETLLAWVTHGSMQRYCEFYLATDGNWYMALAPNEYGESHEAEHYGPFPSEEQAKDALSGHSNPGGYNTDDSGTQPPPDRPRK